MTTSSTLVWINERHYMMSFCSWWERHIWQSGLHNEIYVPVRLSLHTLCVHPRTCSPILLLPPLLMSLIKDLSPGVSLWSSLRSQRLHPWNWRLQWILSPLISFILILSGSFYCSVLTFSLGSIHREVVSFVWVIWVAVFQQTDPWHLIWTPTEEGCLHGAWIIRHT